LERKGCAWFDQYSDWGRGWCLMQWLKELLWLVFCGWERSRHYYGEREKRVDSQRFPLCFVEPKFFEREWGSWD
jgi:hypothetical protein